MTLHTPSIVYNRDCLAAMREMEDNAFDLAFVDAPYGIEDKISIGGGSHTKSTNKLHQRYSENHKKWDIRPSAESWEQLFRVSKNQVIFGANYFTPFLPPSRGWFIWDKVVNGMSSVNNEVVYTSFDFAMKTFRRSIGMDNGFLSDHKVFHPTTKPVALYEWVIANYGTDATSIIDPFLGSGSSRIAAYKAKIAFTGFELDKDYFDAAEQRFLNHAAQLTMF